MKKFAFGTQAMLRVCLLAFGCAGITFACSSSNDSSGTTAGSGGTAGDSQAGQNSGGTQAGTTQGGKAGASQGGKSGSGGMAGKTSTQAGEAGAGAGETGAGGAASGGENAGGASSEAGAGGAGGSGMAACAEGAFCDVGGGCKFSGKCKTNVCEPIDPKLATVDQSQLGGNTPDSWNVSDAEQMGQFITVGKTGLLTGVELSLSVDCKATVGNLNLYVYDAMSKALLGKAFIPMTDIACQTGGNLVADKIGKAFWDLSSQCIGVESGQKIRVELRSPTMGRCVADHCVGGPYPTQACNTDLLCTGIVISASQPSTYAGGSIAMGENAGSPDDNLNFKTFVLE
jgi:hypothetical protein